MADIAAILLAAGRASRYRAAGGAEATKLIAAYRGQPLVRYAAQAARASRARPLVVVTGHARDEVKAALDGLDVDFAHNPDFAEGLSTSLRVGVAALPDEVAGAVVLLGDMPEIASATIDALIAGFQAAAGALAAVPLLHGRRGNPVLLGRGLFAEVAGLHGDEGARRLLQTLDPARLVGVPVDAAGVALDVDVPEDSLALRVRDAGPSDEAAIVAAIVVLQEHERRLSDTRRPGAEVSAAYYRRLVGLAAENGAMLVAEVGDAFAGFIVGWIEQADEICETEDSNRFGYVSDLCVPEPFRGRRVAAALLRALERRLAGQGVTRLRLNFLAGSVAAKAAYEREGYAPYECRYEAARRAEVAALDAGRRTDYRGR